MLRSVVLLIGSFISMGLSAPSMAMSSITEIEGSLSDSTTGPLTRGTYHVIGTILVDLGETLTIEPGVVLKFTSPEQDFRVRGTLNVNGLGNDPVVFTSIKDDTAGGDTNGDGSASDPQSGDWNVLFFINESASGSVLEHLEVRYGGFRGFTSVILYGLEVNITMRNCTIRDSAGSGLDLVGLESHPSITECRFIDNERFACSGVPLDAIPGFVDNEASGNGFDCTEVLNGGFDADIEISPRNVVGTCLVMASGAGVASGHTLTLHAGLVLKFTQFRELIVDGNLICLGTPEQPIVLTSFFDDEFGGDLDGADPDPSPGNWDNVLLRSGADGAVQMKHCIIRYASSGIASFKENVELESVRVERVSGRGFWFFATPKSVENLTAYRCGTEGIHLGASHANLDRSTAVLCDRGIVADPGFSGVVSSSIAYHNVTANVFGMDLGEWVFSNGDASQSGQDGNIDVDPLFLDFSTGNLSLDFLSPCIDAGNPNERPIGPQSNGAPRLMDGLLDGIKRVDMGSHELSRLYLSTQGTWEPGGSVSINTEGDHELDAYLFAGVRVTEIAFGVFGELYVDLGAPFVLVPLPPTPGSLDIFLPADLPSPLQIVLQALGVDGARGNVSNRLIETL